MIQSCRVQWLCERLCWKLTPWIVRCRSTSGSAHAQEEYFKSLIKAFALNTAHPDPAEHSGVHQQSSIRRSVRGIKYQRLLSKPIDNSLMPKVDQSASVKRAKTPDHTLLKPSTPLKLPEADSFLGQPENSTESPIPISSLVHCNQTVTESVELVRKWFTELDLNTLTAPILNAGNLAPYVSRCHTLQQLVLLGVDLSKVEVIPGAANMLIKMDFHQVIEPMLWTLYDLGFDLTKMARLLTRFPKLLKLSPTELSDRFGYFIQHGFSQNDAVSIVYAQPLVLSCKSVDIDRHLGQIQTLFEFSTPEMRLVVTNTPAILMHPLGKIKDIYVVVTKMCGYPSRVCRTMACDHPKLLTAERDRIVKNFAFMHTRLNLPIERIQIWPEALTAVPHLLPERTTFLVRRGLFQPDPTKPLYTPLSTVVRGTDEEFCVQFGRTTEDEYNLFLKTL